MTFSTLRALHAVIGTAIEDIERIYHNRSPQLEYPSLDEPYYPGVRHTSNEELAESLKANPAVFEVSKKIVAACGQLSAMVNEPWIGLMDDVKGGQLAACIRFLEAANVVEILREAGPGGLHAEEIVKAILDLRPKAYSSPAEFPLTASTLSRILRLLATSHYLLELKPNVFTNNRRSSFLDSGKSLEQLRNAPEKKYTETSGVAAHAALMGDEVLKSISYLSEWALPDLAQGESRNGVHVHFPNDKPPVSEEKLEGAIYQDVRMGWVAPFHLAFNTKLNFFEWLELPGNTGRLARFESAMMGSRHWETKDGILQGFSWEDLAEGSVVVDVGGGIGATSIIVAEAHPHVRVIVEDRAQVVSTATSAWGTQYSHLFESGRMSYRPRDFFQPWVPLTLPDESNIEAPSVFLVRLILHDWPTDKAREILRILRGAAKEHTKLLIGDMLLPYACAEASEPNKTASESPFVPYDSPLLPNLGKANMHGYLTDLVMMGMFNGQERTVDEMKALVLSAGWSVAEIRRTPGSLWAYTIAVPV